MLQLLRLLPEGYPLRSGHLGIGCHIIKGDLCAYQVGVYNILLPCVLGLAGVGIAVLPG